MGSWVHSFGFCFFWRFRFTGVLGPESLSLIHFLVCLSDAARALLLSRWIREEVAFFGGRVFQGGAKP